MKQASKAWNIFDRYLQDSSNNVAPERFRLELINHQGQAAILLGDLSKYVFCLESGLAGAIVLGSQKRFDEAYSIFLQKCQSHGCAKGQLSKLLSVMG